MRGAATRSIIKAGVFLLAAVLGTLPLWAHAVLVASEPAANATVPGPDVTLALHFNSRIDNKLSKIILVDPDQGQHSLTLETQAEPQTLNAQARGLRPGTYQVRWQVLASDGHITRGQYTFNVR